MELPSAIIIGAMKCGTSSLFHSLVAQPKVGKSRKKEINYFNNDENYILGIDWYKSFFVDSDLIKIEGSTNYSKWGTYPSVIERIHNLIPNAKFIYQVRNPIDRIVSHLHHNLIKQRINPVDIDEFILSESGETYIEVSNYYFQISKYLEYFPLDNFCFTSFEEFRYEPKQVIRKVLLFLDTDPGEEISLTFKNISSHKKTLRFPFNKMNMKWIPINISKKKVFYIDWLYKKVPRPVLKKRTRKIIVQMLQENHREFEKMSGLTIPLS